MTTVRQAIEYTPVKINQTPVTNPDTNILNQAIQNQHHYVALPGTLPITIGLSQPVGNIAQGVGNTLSNADTTLGNINKVFASFSKPDFGTNALGLIIGIIIAFIAIGALLYEQNPIMKTLKSVKK